MKRNLNQPSSRFGCWFSLWFVPAPMPGGPGGSTRVEKQRGSLVLRKLPNLVLMMFLGVWLCGCTTVSVYQSPVSDFQTAVNAANDSIRPYLLGVNNLIAEANLYDKVGLDRPWGTEDLHAGIPPEEIQVRLQALTTIASYA